MEKVKSIINASNTANKDFTIVFSPRRTITCKEALQRNSMICPKGHKC